MPSVAIVGAGWSGATVARSLADRGMRTEVLERSPHAGGHARSEQLNGVWFEPNGPHIFHTSNRAVMEYVTRLGVVRPYEHRVLTEVFPDGDDGEPRLLSWPPQIDELRTLPAWRQIERELAIRPAAPHGDDFETWVISLMGPTLYEMFVRGYTEKQWGVAASELSSAVAPRRVDLRSDGNTRLFRDTWEFFPPTGYQDAIAASLAGVAVTLGCEVTVDDLDNLARDHDAVVLTCPLDDFLGRPGELAWRGIRTEAVFHDTDADDGTVTAAYCINRPSPTVPYTRTIETKHATGQRVRGTVVGHEYPGAPARHYPVPTRDRRHEATNAALKREIADHTAVPVFFCGRLADYTYIDQDAAIEQAWDCAATVATALQR